MTISTGNPVAAADLNALVWGETWRQSEKSVQPGVQTISVNFEDLSVGSSALFNEANFVAPYDCDLVAVGFVASGTTGITYTVTITGALTDDIVFADAATANPHISNRIKSVETLLKDAQYNIRVSTTGVGNDHFSLIMLVQPKKGE